MLYVSHSSLLLRVNDPENLVVRGSLRLVPYFTVTSPCVSISLPLCAIAFQYIVVTGTTTFILALDSAWRVVGKENRIYFVMEYMDYSVIIRRRCYHCNKQSSLVFYYLFLCVVFFFFSFFCFFLYFPSFLFHLVPFVDIFCTVENKCNPTGVF